MGADRLTCGGSTQEESARIADVLRIMVGKEEATARMPPLNNPRDSYPLDLLPRMPPDLARRAKDEGTPDLQVLREFLRPLAHAAAALSTAKPRGGMLESEHKKLRVHAHRLAEQAHAAASAIVAGGAENVAVLNWSEAWKARANDIPLQQPPSLAAAPPEAGAAAEGAAAEGAAAEGTAAEEPVSLKSKFESFLL